MCRFQFNLRTLFWTTLLAAVVPLQWAGETYGYAQHVMRAAVVGFLLAAATANMLKR